MERKNVLKYGDYAVKVTLVHHLFVSNRCFYCDVDMGGMEVLDCDFWLYKSEKSANKKIEELKSKYNIVEGCEDEDEYYSVRKEICFLWD